MPATSSVAWPDGCVRRHWGSAGTVQGGHVTAALAQQPAELLELVSGAWRAVRLLMQALVQVQGMYGRPILYKNALDCARQIVAAQGVGGLYRGVWGSLLKVRAQG